MASMDTLIKEIYFEKQQEGSMLCAQHALNSLLQGEYFTAPDLATIATRLDRLEAGYDDTNIGDTSTNMDDTGFFSIQVIEEALKPWSLSLLRWRSELMLPYHDRPHCQLAFILNSQQHWYTLRRFGEALPDFTVDPGTGHWFDLNSFNKNPMWVGKTFLGMTLQQAEEVGYSVFAVVQDDPSKPLALPRSEADHIAAFVTEDSRPSAAYRSGEAKQSTSNSLGLEHVDDEDADLQAALQASISGNAYYTPSSSAQPVSRRPQPSGSTRSATSSFSRRSSRQGSRQGSMPPLRRPTTDFDMMDNDDDFAPVIPPRPTVEDLDPIAASRARSQAYMQQVMREQEAALQETREAEIAAFEAGHQPRRRNPRRGEEEDELQRAIQASRALHGARGFNDEEVELDEVLDLRREQGQQSISAFGGPDRVYDDEDAELQAALQASLADVPPGFAVPSPPPRAAPPLVPVSQSQSSAASSTSTLPPSSAAQDIVDDRDTETESEADTTVDVEEEREQVTMEEMRRRRLARFGG